MNTIIGHQSQIGRLQRAAATSHCGNAYLFAGAEGIGKKRVALFFAQMLACAHPQIQGGPCQQCLNCQKIARGIHPDVKIVEVEEEATQLKIKQVAEIQAAIMLRPLEAKKKIFIFNDAHLFSVDAAHSLLKTLEEPPPDTVLILVTARPAVLLPTILSRCQRVDFTSLPEEELEQFLSAERKLSLETAHFLARFSGGSVGRAYHYLALGIMEQKTSVEEFLSRLAATSVDELLKGIAQLVQNKERLQLFLDILLYLLYERYLETVKNGTDQYKTEEVLRFLLRWRSAALKSVNQKLALEHIFLERKYA